MAPDLNEQIEEVIDDATVITVPIDDTLSNSGEAADAKATGDALALKADKSELQTAVTVNGQSADAQGAILVTAEDTKMSSSDNTTVKAKIEAVDGKTATDIKMSSDPSAQTISQAMAASVDRTADQIEMSAEDETTVKTAIDDIKTKQSTDEGDITALKAKTGADIKYTTGDNETIKEHVDALEDGLVKSVNGFLPDEDGDVEVERVPYADNLYSEEMEQVDASFLQRTAGGSLGISGSDAWILRLIGNREHTGFTPEALSLTVNAIPRTAPAAITASLNKTTFIARAGTAGTYEFNYTDSWDENPVEWGITVSNEPIDGDEMTVVWDGENDPVLSVNAATRTAPPEITASIVRDVWVSAVSTTGSYTFTYSTVWKLNGTEVDMEDYGITIANDPVAGDEIVVAYTKEVRGTITMANPSALIATGWNLYDHTNGYAKVVKYSNSYGYAISGTYSAIAWAATPDGETTAITPDENGLFTISADGYIIVTGGNGTDTAIWPTWSDWDEGYDGSWEAYSENSVDLSSVMSSKFPYGLCKIVKGDTIVRDEINVGMKQAISRISRSAYSEENRAAAVASGRAYEYDEDYIYVERATPVTSAITLDEEYSVDDHGLEWFTGTTIEIYTEILYGQNLKDKLRRDVVTIREQTFTNGQKAIARNNIGAAEASATNNMLDALQDGLAIVANGNTHPAIAAGQYVFVKNHGTLAAGLYVNTSGSTIAQDATLSTSNLTADTAGGLNSLNSKIDNLIIYTEETGTDDTYYSAGTPFIWKSITTPTNYMAIGVAIKSVTAWHLADVSVQTDNNGTTSIWVHPYENGRYKGTLGIAWLKYT